MNFKNGLVTAKAFDCFAKDFQKEKQTIVYSEIVTPTMLRNRRNTKLNEKIFNEVKNIRN